MPWHYDEPVSIEGAKPERMPVEMRPVDFRPVRIEAPPGTVDVGTKVAVRGGEYEVVAVRDLRHHIDATIEPVKEVEAARAEDARKRKAEEDAARPKKKAKNEGASHGE